MEDKYLYLLLFGLFFLASIPLTYWSTDKILRGYTFAKPRHNRMTTTDKFKFLLGCYSLGSIPALLYFASKKGNFSYNNAIFMLFIALVSYYIMPVIAISPLIEIAEY